MCSFSNMYTLSKVSEVNLITGWCVHGLISKPCAAGASCTNSCSSE